MLTLIQYLGATSLALVVGWRQRVLGLARGQRKQSAGDQPEDDEAQQPGLKLVGRCGQQGRAQQQRHVKYETWGEVLSVPRVAKQLRRRVG